MELYRDFDYESDSFEEINNNKYSQLKHKDKNTFVFESFSSKLKKLSVRISEKINIDYSILKLNESEKIKKDEDKSMKYSNFKSLLEREFSINNHNPEFLTLYNLLNEYSSSYIYLLNNYKKVFNILKDDIQKKIDNKFYRGIFLSLDLLIAVIKDLRGECYDYFIENNLSQIINITKIDNDINNEVLFDLIDHLFTFFVNIFKFYKNSFEGNFEKILFIYSDLLFNKNKFIRKFASQSLCYIIKNLDDIQLTKTFNFLFNFIIHPEKLFEEKDIEMLNKDDYSSKNILFQNLSSFNLKIFISDCLSELLIEVLTNRNVLSNKCDIFIFKLKGIESNLKSKNEILLIFIHTFLKLIKKVREDNKISIVCLLHYFLLTFYSEKELNFKKMKLQSLVNQLGFFDESNFKNEKIILGLLLYSKEILNKNFKDKSITYSFYINSLLEKLEKYIKFNEINLNASLIIEIYSLMLKFHNAELTLNINKILKKEEYIKFLFETLTNLNLFSFYQSFSTFSIRNPNDSIDNDEYNNILYNKEKFEDIIISIINDNDLINYELIVEIIKSYETIFGKCEINLINKNSVQNKIKIYLSSIKKEEISSMIYNMNEINYDKLMKLFMISSMINEESILNIIIKEIIKYLSLFKQKKIDFDEFLINILFNDFYLNEFHYINKIQMYLNILKSFKSSDETLKEIINNQCPYLFSFINFFSFTNNYNDLKTVFSNEYFYLILLSNDNINKANFVKLFQNYFYEKYKNECCQNNKKEIIKEIFLIMDKICRTNFDYLNDKKYSLNYEIIVSQLELLLSNEEITKFNLDLVIFSLFFLLGNFWITLTKSVWPIISKSLENLFSIIIKSSEIKKYEKYESDIKTNILELINKLLIFIANYSSESDFFSKNYSRIKNEWISLKNNESIHKLSIQDLQIKYRTISTFFNGINLGLLSSYYILLNSNQIFSFYFLDNCFLKIGHLFKHSQIEEIFSKPKNKTDLCILYNFIIEKEMKSSFSNTIFKLKDCLFLIISKLKFLINYNNIDSIKKIIFEQIILSRSINIQKLSIEIISLFDERIKNYLNLLNNIIESPVIINQLFNLDKIINDKGLEIKEEERESLIPIITRLYYSKYFHLKDSTSEKGKKIKTKNKINLINYFIQLRQNEFEEYINIVFEPVFLIFENQKEENFNVLNMRIYNKLLQILKLNLKQITKLFKNNEQISIISNKLKLCFIYLKQLGQQIKINKEEIINLTEKYINQYLINESKIINAYDKEEFSNFFEFIHKNIKDLKRESFNVFTMIFNQFYDNINLISDISKSICNEYIENLKKPTTKINSIYKFFISLSKHAKLHFIFSENPIIVQSIMNVVKKGETERNFILNIIEFIENILSPYSIESLNKNENENITEMEIDDDEDSNNFNFNFDDSPIDDKTLQDNFDKIIIFNFNEINSSLTSLIFNNKIGTSIKDKLTLSIIHIFLSLWGLYTNSNKNKNINYQDLNVNDILNFLLKILEKDKKIYTERDILNNVLKLSHILISIKIKYQSGKLNIEEMRNLYKKYVSLIYKVENYNNRLVVSIILQEFSFLDPTNKLINVLELISYLNSNKQKNRELGKELDTDSVIEKINLINENFINEHLNVIEPLIYQLIILSSNEDFALSTLALDKSKLIFRKISLLNLQENFISVINVLFYLLNEKFSQAKIVLELLYEINTKTPNKFSCSDLFEISNEDKSNNFLLNILNFKYDLRSEALDLLMNTFLDSNKNISEYSILNVIIPIIKNFLNFKNYSENPSNLKKFSTLKRKNEILFEIVNKSISILPELVKRISDEEIEKLLLYFYSNLKKISNNKYKDNMYYSIDIYKMTNQSLTKILECIILIKFNKIEFDLNYKKISEKYINEKVEEMELKYKDINNTKEKITFKIRDFFINIFEDLDKNLNDTISEFSNNNIYIIIKNQIYPQLKNLLYDNEKRLNKSSYYIRNYIIIPYLNILKILKPKKIITEIIQLTIELVNSLQNLDTDIRSKAREGIKNMINILGESIIIILFENMRTTLHSGYQRHVLSYTINYLLSFINNYQITEISLHLIMPIIFDEIFGDISEEKEVDNLVNKYKEAKKEKGYNSFELISQKINITSLILGVITPFKNYLIVRKNTSEIIHKVNEVLSAIVRGLKNNILINKDNINEINNILEYSYIFTHMGIEKNIQNAKEIKKMKNIEIKGNDIFTIDISENYRIEIANKYIEEKNEILYSNLFASLGLDFILILLKKKIFDISKITQGTEIYDKLNSLINNVVICLKMSNNTILVSKAIKIIITFIEVSEKFFIIKKNLNKIVKNLFKLILSINQGDTLLSQSVLSGISTILTKFTFIQVPKEKIKTCIQFLKLNINNLEIKPYILSCFLALIKRKILHPDIYDMINFLREIYLTSFEENTINICYRIFFEFINNYPLEKKGRMNHINFFIINCDSKTRKCKINSIKMLINFISKKMEGIEENFDFILLNLFTLYMNSSDSEIKENITILINQLYDKYDKNNFKSYYEKALSILSEISQKENNKKMISLSLVMISIMLNLKFDFINKSLMNTLTNLLNIQIDIFESLIEEKMNKYDYLIKGENTIKINNINVEDYNTLYLILNCIEKANQNYLMEITNEILKKIIICLNHPHSFIKTISLRIILKNSNKIIFNDDLVNIISHLKFIIMANDFEDKIYEYSEKLIFNFISDKNLSKNDNLLDLFTTLCNESKKWISNKETGLSIINRVTNIFEKVVECGNLFYFKPIIELCYRINNNNLADNEMKKKCNVIMENISLKMKKKELTEIYKNVTKEVNFLKQKRKLEQVENFRKKHEGKSPEEFEQKNILIKEKTKENKTKITKNKKRKK